MNASFVSLIDSTKEASASSLNFNVSVTIRRYVDVFKPSNKKAQYFLTSLTASSSKNPLIPAYINATCCGTDNGEFCGCFKTSRKRVPRANCFCVA